MLSVICIIYLKLVIFTSLIRYFPHSTKGFEGVYKNIDTFQL